MDMNDGSGPGQPQTIYFVYDACGNMLFPFINAEDAYRFSAHMPNTYVRGNVGPPLRQS